MEDKIKIAFVVGIFPAPSETFIIDQVAGLLERGIQVKLFSFHRGDLKAVSQIYKKYRMDNLVTYLEMPANRIYRFLKALPQFMRLSVMNPRVLFRSLDFKKYGKDSTSLKLLYWTAPFVGQNFDLVHAHGMSSDDFLKIKEILDLKQKAIATFYGREIGHIEGTKKLGEVVYSRLRNGYEKVIVMSDFVRTKFLERGFDPEKVIVNPVGIDPMGYNFKERHNTSDTIEIVSVGRFVEKKGFDDLLKALKIVKDKIGPVFHCAIVGDGPLRIEINKLSAQLGLADVLKFTGTISIESIINLFSRCHFYVQASKTAANGDIE